VGGDDRRKNLCVLNAYTYQALGCVSSHDLRHLILTMLKGEYNNQNCTDEKTEAYSDLRKFFCITGLFFF
jgi:hypothetical protein